MERLGKYIKPHIWAIVLALAIKFVGTYTELWIPKLMEILLRGETAQGGYKTLLFYGGLMILCAALCLTLNVTANRMTAFTSGKIIKKIRHDLYEKIQNLSARQMDQLTVHSAESRLTSDTYNVNVLLTRIQRMGIRAPIMLVGGIVMLVGMDAQLALILVGLLPLISLTMILVSKKGRPLYSKQQEKLDEVVRTVQENVTGIRVIKALSKSEYEKERFGGVNKALSDIGQKAGMITSVGGPVSSVIMNVGLTLVVVVGAYRVNSGAIGASVIIAALQYFTMILQAMMSITRIFIMWNRGQASALRVAEVLDLPEDLTVEPAQQPEENAPHICFRDVSFSYTGVDKNIESLNFSLEKGQTLGILGGTGSGKSTILNLLLRMYDPDEGKILIDGQDIKTIPMEQLRQKFGVVFQNDFVAGGTIAGNIRFFRDIPDEAVEKAAACAQAEFIAEKEGGMDAEVLMRGNNLSGGQKQRLLIARALAADPEILVLDDASSALDYQTDSKLRKALRENYRDTTTVLVTQRVSSLRHADLILVISDGCVIGAGDHHQLMETCEEYRLIARTQMREEKEVL